MTHSVHSCLCVDCLDYRDRVKAAKRRRGLRDLSLFSPVAANRDAAAGAETPSVRVTRDTRTEGSNHPLGKAREAADPRSVRLLTESRQGDTETADPRLTVARGRHLNSEPGNDRLGQTSSAVTGEGCALDNLPQAGASGVSGPAVHRGRHVAARAVTNGGPRLGVAS